MPSEIEVKLDLSPEAVESLRNSGILGEPARSVRQISTYYDTGDGLLSAHGFSLRIRQAGEKRTQTVKATGDGASLFARSEWEMPLSGSDPVLDHSNPLASTFGEDLILQPIFDVDVVRTIWNVTEGGSSIEAALDLGDVVADERRMTVRELELELKEGDQADLFTLARKLEGVAPFRFGVRTKAERGYLLSEPQHYVYKAEKLSLDGTMRAVTAFQVIASSCFRHFRLNEDILHRRRNPEALHQARVALRRLRSAFVLFKPLLTGEEPKRLADEMRWLAAVLGDARNLDVLLAKAEDEEIRVTLHQARESAYDAAIEALDSSRARSLMMDFNHWLHCGGYMSDPETADLRDSEAAEYGCDALDRMRRKLKKHGRDLAGIDDAHRHEARKDAKKLRYAAEFFGSLFEAKRSQRRYQRFIAAMEELQDHLGALNDLATGPGVLESHGLADHPGRHGLITREDKDDIIEAAQGALDDVLDTKRFWR